MKDYIRKNTRKIINIALDVDDVLFPCNEYAIQLINEKGIFDTPLQLSEVYKWEKRNDRSDEILKYYEDAEFWKNQPIYPGAKEFVYELSKYANIFFTSAIDPKFMSIRALKLIEAFPEIPKENIILGSRKDMYSFDIILDDAPHNIINSKAMYPILFRKPWNANLTGLLSVNDYEEALNMILSIINRKEIELDKADIVVLVGPSGSGKTAIANNLINKGLFEKPKSTTTRNKRNDETGDEYNFISKEEFINRKNHKSFIETSIYGGNYYGLEINSLDFLLTTNKRILLILDICGAMAVKNKFPNTSLCFINRNKKDVVNAILNRQVSNEDKTNRILALSDEYKNEELCDTVLDNNNSIEDAVEQFINYYCKNKES